MANWTPFWIDCHGRTYSYSDVSFVCDVPGSALVNDQGRIASGNPSLHDSAGAAKADISGRYLST